MTRQTKVGLVVAGSFLCIVGGYLGLRMRSEATQTQSQAGTEQAATEPVPPDQSPVVAPSLVMAPAPELQPAPTSNPTPEPVVKTPEPVMPPPPVANLDPPPQQIQTPAPVEVPKPDPAPIVPENKQPDPPVEAPKPIAPLTEFKSVEPKQDSPKPIEATPPVQEPIKPAEPLPPAKDLPKPGEQAPGSASLVHEAAPPRPLPDPLPNVQPASGTRPAPKGPVSDSFLEEEYRLQTGDTFASVSRRFYFSDKYSIALQQYNREYPIGSPNLKQDPPRLAAGTVVWIPPIRVLEKRYPTMIADYKPLPNAAVAGPATAAAPTWTPAPARQVAASSKTYRVRDGGESMIDIARRTLNNPQAWQTIYQMNPSLNPNSAAPIPAGTLLRVPGDARD
jgi:LysM domain